MADRPELSELLATVERLHELADAAELMDDEAGAAHLRALAVRGQSEAMDRLDE